MQARGSRACIHQKQKGGRAEKVLTSVPPVLLCLPFVVSEVHVGGIDHHHHVPHVLLGIVRGLVLAL